jgi:hypothetical protein
MIQDRTRNLTRSLNSCRLTIAEPYLRIPLDALALPKRVRHALRAFFYLREINGMRRARLRELRGMGKKSLAQLEDFLAAALGTGFHVVAEKEWIEPRLPGIMGRPVLELIDGN